MQYIKWWHIFLWLTETDKASLSQRAWSHHIPPDTWLAHVLLNTQFCPWMHDDGQFKKKKQNKTKEKQNFFIIILPHVDALLQIL